MRERGSERRIHHPILTNTRTYSLSLHRSVQNKAKNDREIMEKTFLNGEAGTFMTTAYKEEEVYRFGLVWFHGCG